MNAVQWKAIATAVVKEAYRRRVLSNILAGSIGERADNIQELVSNETHIAKEELVHWLENINWEE